MPCGIAGCIWCQSAVFDLQSMNPLPLGHAGLEKKANSRPFVPSEAA